MQKTAYKLSPVALIDLFKQFGTGYIMSTLGMALANADGVMNEVLNALRQDPSGRLFSDIFLRGKWPLPDQFTALNARLGNAVHQMEQSYNASSRLRGGFQNPSFGKLSAVQEKYEAGEKTPVLPNSVSPVTDPVNFFFSAFPITEEPVVDSAFNYWITINSTYREVVPCVPGNYKITDMLGPSVPFGE